MRLPEVAVAGRCFRKLRGMKCVRVYIHQRKVAIDETELRPHDTLHCLDGLMHRSAIGALEITVFEECHRSISSTLNVIGRSDWWRKMVHYSCSLKAVAR